MLHNKIDMFNCRSNNWALKRTGSADGKQQEFVRVPRKSILIRLPLLSVFFWKRIEIRSAQGLGALPMSRKPYWGRNRCSYTGRTGWKIDNGIFNSINGIHCFLRVSLLRTCRWQRDQAHFICPLIDLTQFGLKHTKAWQLIFCSYRIRLPYIHKSAIFEDLPHSAI